MIFLNDVKEKEVCFLSKDNYNSTDDCILNNALRAAEAHKVIRYNLQNFIKPGTSLKSIIEYVENSTRTMLSGELNNGIGFPCGVSLNNCAAHFSLNPWDDDIILQEDDVLSIDYGTHCDGRIVDSAFTVAFNNKFTNLLKATHEATTAATKMAGIDTQVCELGKYIEEIITSYEIFDQYNNSIPIKPVENLNGHSIGRFKIHDGLHIPSIDNKDTSRITEGFIAIETFASTGRGWISEDGECSHYMLPQIEPRNRIYDHKNKNLFNLIKEKVSTLPFSPQHLLYYDPTIKKTAFKLLSARKFIDPYPPLFDFPKNCNVAQFEHTIYLSESKKVVVSQGDDF